VERRQHVLVVDDLRDRLRELRAVLPGEGLDRFAGLVFVLGVGGVGQVSARALFAAGCADLGSASRIFAVL